LPTLVLPLLWLEGNQMFVSRFIDNSANSDLYPVPRLIETVRSCPYTRSWSVFSNIKLNREDLGRDSFADSGKRRVFLSWHDESTLRGSPAGVDTRSEWYRPDDFSSSSGNAKKFGRLFARDCSTITFNSIIHLYHNQHFACLFYNY